MSSSEVNCLTRQSNNQTKLFMIKIIVIKFLIVAASGWVILNLL